MNSNIKRWLEDPVTKKYRSLLQEHKEAHIKRMLDLVVIDQNTLPLLAQIKGQVNAIDLMLDNDQLENFFEGEITND